MDKRVARALGITTAGLRQLARGAARPDGDVGGGMGTVRLERQGLAAPADPERRAVSAYTPSVITDAGRELVARARRMGW
jgi:hypothetical protein